jgi:hypothetical protein
VTRRGAASANAAPFAELPASPAPAGTDGVTAGAQSGSYSGRDWVDAQRRRTLALACMSS